MQSQALRAGFPNFPNLTHNGHGELFGRGRKCARQSMASTVRKSPACFALSVRVGKRILPRPQAGTHRTGGRFAPCIVTLNLFQGPSGSFTPEAAGLAERWTLKQVQGDGVGNGFGVRELARAVVSSPAFRTGFRIFANFTHSGHGELFAAAGNVLGNQWLRR
ncbi:MAG: hypothetical protein LBV50_12420 [Novosphingobium sp.]|jgi:hypothetical protein|nr:hypothetical protein [Novosphingobium sp.]